MLNYPGAQKRIFEQRRRTSARLIGHKEVLSQGLSLIDSAIFITVMIVRAPVCSAT